MSQTPVPNYEAAWDFLNRFHGPRAYVVTGIGFDRAKIPTETFFESDRDRFLKWIGACGLDCNIYFSVGEPLHPATKKLERTDIKAVHYLHVDVDPKPGSDLKLERERILASLRAPAGGIPPPTLIVFSGGGYQAYWKLAAPLPVGGDLAAAEDFSLYNLYIAGVLGGDHCHDVSRIMRLPGTLNVPDAKKKKLGRTPEISAIVEWHEDRVYDISQFLKAPKVQTADDARGGATLSAPANVRRLKDVHELPPEVKMGVKVYIVQGKDPDDPNHFASRSEMLFWVCCELVRANVPDDVIYSVITDPEFKISESVLEKRNGAERYAMRQIERAKEQAIDPVLRELNDRFAVIENYGGRCLVIEEEEDLELDGRLRLAKQGFTDFKNRFCNRLVQGGTDKKNNPVMMPAGLWWLNHPGRRQYRRVAFLPGREVPGVYNLFRGYGCDAVPGDCTLFLDHLKQIVCSGVQENYDYLIRWFARAVQEPSRPAGTAVVLRGRMGSGKSIVPVIIGKLFGRHYFPVTKPEHLTGNFNSHLRDVIFLFADEAFFAGDKRHESFLKTLITQPEITVEAKGVDVDIAANCVHLLIASNEKWVVPAGGDDRRYFVLDVKSDRMGDRAYFDAIFEQLNKGGYEALLHHLMTLDLSGYRPDPIPSTAALIEQKRLSMDPEIEWWYQILRRGTALSGDAEWKNYVPVDALSAEYVGYSRAFNLSRRSNSTRMGLLMDAVLPGKGQRFQRASPIEITTPSGEKKLIPRPWCFRLPPLEECRKFFDENHGGPFIWKADLPAEEIPDYAGEAF